MKNILCFGDSITWGYVPLTAERFDIHTRWPGVLRDALGTGYHVVEEGLCGRTTIWDHPFIPNANGLTHLPMLLASHAPLDLVIVMLGGNDVQPAIGKSARDAVRGAGRLVDAARKSLCGPGMTPPKLLLLTPPPPLGQVQGLMRIAFEGADPASMEMGRWGGEVAAALACGFLDAAEFARASDGPDGDGVHPDAGGHSALGRAVAAKVLEMLG